MNICPDGNLTVPGGVGPEGGALVFLWCASYIVHCTAWCVEGAELEGFVVENLRQGISSSYVWAAPSQLRRLQQLLSWHYTGCRVYTATPSVECRRKDHRVAPLSGLPREQGGPWLTFLGCWADLGSS